MDTCHGSHLGSELRLQRTAGARLRRESTSTAVIWFRTITSMRAELRARGTAVDLVCQYDVGEDRSLTDLDRVHLAGYTDYFLMISAGSRSGVN